ncbi:hypothetical protein GS399_16940 [Pedobacter sp. HMF7647]|uniref:NHL repeat-containing protein n=1 Tax=Hufsiella arboris TaxID=2695275 RepID=A0A7K1YDJ3_9SPHI|nr:hypothetical protein [Hufsiella arboris]MXV52663.1 hypothetical protein [Hufsiella arboris]
MNLKITSLTWVVVSSFLFVTCKEENFPEPDAQLSTTDQVKAMVNIPPYTLYTVAGGSSLAPMFRDGEGRDAHFSGPAGIQLKNKDTLYIADAGNSAIRKVVLKPGPNSTIQYVGTVTTLNTPTGSNGLKMLRPLRVGVSDDGTINVLFNTLNNIVFGRIYKPGRSIYTVQTSNLNVSGMSQDPYQEFFWFTGAGGIGKFWSDHIQLPNFTIPRDTLAIRSPGGGLFTLEYPNAIYAGPNGVKYLVTAYQLYKFTQERVFTKIAPVFTIPPYNYGEVFPNATDIAATADGRTIFLASDGAIKKVENGIVSNIYYPRGRTSTTGIETDINAWGLAIDDKRHILYFTDRNNNGVRMMTLPGYKGH